MKGKNIKKSSRELEGEKKRIGAEAKKRAKRKRWFFVLAALAFWALISLCLTEKGIRILQPTLAGSISGILGIVGWIFLVCAAEVSERKIKTKLQ